jgi:hypothetical protein
MPRHVRPGREAFCAGLAFDHAWPAAENGRLSRNRPRSRPYTDGTKMPQSGRQRGAAIAAVVAAVALLGVGGWWAGWFGPFEDPRIKELRLLQDELIRKYPPERGPQSLAEAAERAAAIGGFMLKVQALPAELRPQAIQSGRAAMLRIVDTKAQAYFALPAAERQQFLDAEIRQGELMRQAFEAGKTALKWAGLGGRGAGKDKSPGGGGPTGGSQDDRNRWRKSMIDMTTPAQRSRITEYIGAIEVRRHQLGLPPAPFGP